MIIKQFDKWVKLLMIMTFMLIYQIGLLFIYYTPGHGSLELTSSGDITTLSAKFDHHYGANDIFSFMGLDYPINNIEISDRSDTMNISYQVQGDTVLFEQIGAEKTFTLNTNINNLNRLEIDNSPAVAYSSGNLNTLVWTKQGNVIRLQSVKNMSDLIMLAENLSYFREKDLRSL